MKLYDDQQDLLKRTVESLNAGRRTIMCLPTGGGKTVIAGRLIHNLNSINKSVLILVHRHELVRQFRATLESVGLGHRCSELTSGAKETAWLPFCIASVQTLVRRLDVTRLDPFLLIIDEAHHAAAASYRKIIARFPKAKLLGMTATPARTDGKGLDDLFDDIVSGAGIRHLIDIKRLSPYKIYAPKILNAQGIGVVRGDYEKKALDQIADGHAIADVVQAVRQRAATRRILVFATSRRASKDLASSLNAAGIRAEHIDGSSDTTMQRREQVLADFADGTIQAVCNVDLISEGFDCPECDCVVMARPTTSTVLYLQQIGRALRYRDGKCAVIIDCSGNMAYHGEPCMDRNWSLEGNNNGKAGGHQNPNAPVNFMLCKVCGKLINKVTEDKCSNCGWEVPDPRPMRQVDVELIEIEIGGGHTLTARSEDGELSSASKEMLARQAYKRGGMDGVLRVQEQLGLPLAWARKQVEKETSKFMSPGRYSR